MRGSQTLHNEKNDKMDALYKNCSSEQTTDLAGTAAADNETTPSHVDHVCHGMHELLDANCSGTRSGARSCPDVSHTLYNCLLCSPLTNACSERRFHNQLPANQLHHHRDTRNVCAPRTSQVLRPGWNAVYSNIDELKVESCVPDTDLEQQNLHNVGRFKSNDNRHSTSSVLLRPTSCNLDLRQSPHLGETNRATGNQASSTEVDRTTSDLYAVPHKHKLKSKLDDLNRNISPVDSFDSMDSGTNSGTSSPVTVKSFNGIIYKDSLNQNVSPLPNSEPSTNTSPLRAALEEEDERRRPDLHPFEAESSQEGHDVEIPLLARPEGRVSGEETEQTSCKYCDSSNPKLKKLCSGHRTFWSPHLKNDRTFPVSAQHEQGRWLLAPDSQEAGDSSHSNKRETTV